MVVFIPPRDDQWSTERPVIADKSDVVPRSVTVDNAKRLISEPLAKPPPFWTWFVENPRNRGV